MYWMLIVLALIQTSSSTADEECDLYELSRALCETDPVCALRMHLSDGDPHAFDYILKTHLLNAPQSEVPYELSSLLQQRLCESNSSDVRTLWIMVMRQAHVCRDSEYFDSVSGDCVCLDGRHCQQQHAGSPKFEALTANILLLVLLGMLLYISVTTISQIHTQQQNLNAACARIHTLSSPAPPPLLRCPTTNFQGQKTFADSLRVQ